MMTILVFVSFHLFKMTRRSIDALVMIIVPLMVIVSGAHILLMRKILVQTGTGVMIDAPPLNTNVRRLR